MLRKTIGLCMAALLVLSCVQPAFAAEAATPPDAANITVTNNFAGTPDTVLVASTTPGDVIKVYSTATASAPLGIAVATTSCTVYIDQLGALAGNVFVSVTPSGGAESARTEKAYLAESTTSAPSTDDIQVVNDITGNLDTVVVSNIVSGDTVRVYSSSNSSAPLATAVSGGTSVTLYIAQLGTGSGSVYVTVQNTDKTESARVEKAYDAEDTTAAPTAGNITVNNYAASSDTVIVTGIAQGDIVNVYGSASSTTAIGTATVGSGQTSATVTIEQIGRTAGTAYVSVRTPGWNESTKTAVSYDSEITDAPAASTITVTNNYSTSSDTVLISGLVTGDVVKVYPTSTSTSVLGTATIAEGATSAEITIEQISAAAGKIYVTVKTAYKDESARTAVSYSSEPKTTAPSDTSITVTNNITGVNDTVAVTGLTEGEVVNIYATATSTSVLGTATVAQGETSVSITIEQIGKTAGKVYVTAKENSKLESVRTVKSYIAEATTTAPIAANVSVSNYSGASDTIVVTGLEAGEVVKVYATSTSTSTIGTATVADGATSATITIDQLGASSGKVYISAKKADANESTRTAVSYASEKTTAPLATTVTVTNNYSTSSDTVLITGLVEGDVVNVYATSTSTPAIGTDTVAQGATSATITIEQLSTAAGKVYVTLTKANKTESTRTAVSYSSEPKATAPSSGSITVTNNITGINDTVTVTGLAAGNIVKVYAKSSSTSPIGTATVAEGETSATITIEQLGRRAGSVYVSVSETGKLESPRTVKAYSAETSTAAPVASKITVSNYALASDTIQVTDLEEGEVIKVYATSTATSALATATVAQGETSVSITIAQLGIPAGKIYVSSKVDDANESTRTAVPYESERTSAPSASTITVTNNYSVSSDTVIVTGLEEGDVVKVYGSSTATSALGTETVAQGATSATITLDQLSSTSGRVYVTLTTANKSESAKTSVSYSSEPKTTAPLASNITATNNVTGVNDTVLVTGLTEGEIVSVYANSYTTTALGTATVAQGETSATVSIEQMTVNAGKVYVTVKDSGKLESSRIAKAYTSEISTAPLSSNIIVINNKVGTDDTVTVSGISAGDIVRVYNATTGGDLLGSGTVSAGTAGIEVHVAQLGTTAGKIYVSVTKSGKSESIRTPKSFLAEAL